MTETKTAMTAMTRQPLLGRRQLEVGGVEGEEVQQPQPGAERLPQLQRAVARSKSSKKKMMSK